MEYYILKLYQEMKKENQNMKQGLDRFQPRLKIIAIICLIVLILASIESLVTILLFPGEFWCSIGLILNLIAVGVLFYIDSKNQELLMDRYVDSHNINIELLNDILITRFKITSEKKVKELINIYQEYVDKKKEEKKSRKSILLTILSFSAGILSISFQNMGVIGINFSGWIFLSTIFLLIIAAISVWIYFFPCFDSLEKKYNIMIKDLKELVLMKY